MSVPIEVKQVDKQRHAQWQPSVVVQVPARARSRATIRSYRFWRGTSLALQGLSVLGGHFHVVPNSAVASLSGFGALLFFGSLMIPDPGAEAPPEIVRLLDLPVSDHQFLANIQLEIDRRPTGEASGVVVFADGWMSFASPEVSFSIRYQDVKSIKECLGGRETTFEFENGIRMKMTFFNKARAGKERVQFSKAARKDRFEEWQSATPDGIAILPPDTRKTS